jgi:hypothetical protein
LNFDFWNLNNKIDIYRKNNYNLNKQQKQDAC